MKEPDLLLLSQIRELASSGEAQRVRELAHLSRSEVAAICGVNQSTVARWETARRSPRGDAGLTYGRLITRLQARVTKAV